MKINAIVAIMAAVLLLTGAVYALVSNDSIAVKESTNTQKATASCGTSGCTAGAGTGTCGCGSASCGATNGGTCGCSANR